MTRQRFRIAQVDQPLDQLQRVVEFGRGLVSATNSEGHQRAGAAAKIFSGKRVIAVVLEPDVVDPLDPIVVAQEFSHAAPIFNMTIDSQRDGLDSLEQQKSAQRRQGLSPSSADTRSGSVRYKPRGQNGRCTRDRGTKHPAR